MKRVLVLIAAALLISHGGAQKVGVMTAPLRIHTLCWAECENYFDWRTVRLMHSYKKVRQPGPITRLLSCRDEKKKKSYRGMDLMPTLEVPCRYPPAINGIIHWLKHREDAKNVDWVVIVLNPDTIIRVPIIPWELGAEKGRPLLGYSVECKTESSVKHCDEVVGTVIIHIDDLRLLAPIWLLKTRVRSHLGTNTDVHGYLLALEEAGLGPEVNNKLRKSGARQLLDVNNNNNDPKIQTIFSAECSPYFDWQTVGLVHSFYNSGQPGTITRLLSCTDENLKHYNGHDLAPTHYVPSMTTHPITGDWYPDINKPAALVHWINHVKIDAEYVVILEADMIMKGPITPWEFNAAPRKPVSTPYGYDFLTGCNTELSKTHTRNPGACKTVGGVIIMHIRDVKRFALLWLHKTEQVRADIALRMSSGNVTTDIYEAARMSEMYGYAFAAAELNFEHVISNEILIKPGNVPVPGVKYRAFHYDSAFRVGNLSFDKANWTHLDAVNTCWSKFPDPPNPSTLDSDEKDSLQRDLLSIECVNSLNEALKVHYERKKCPDPSALLLPPAPNTTLDHPPNEETKTFIGEMEKIDDVNVDRDNHNIEEVNESLSPPEESNEGFNYMRVWMITLWTISIVIFVIVMSIVIASRRRRKRRGKSNLKNLRTSY